MLIKMTSNFERSVNKRFTLEIKPQVISPAQIETLCLENVELI